MICITFLVRGKSFGKKVKLVDIFKNKCGTIVHARILRERNQHGNGKGKSKGWALVQFEERESVEKALALSGVIGLHEKLIKIERSHMPAVALVPAGMNRVNPKGAGKKSKFNESKRNGKALAVESSPKNVAAADSTASPPKEDNMERILAFRPRGVQSKSKKKTKIQLSL